MEDEASEISGALAVNSDGTIVLVDGTQVRDGLAACCFLFVGSSGVSSEHPGLHPTLEGQSGDVALSRVVTDLPRLHASS